MTQHFVLHLLLDVSRFCGIRDTRTNSVFSLLFFHLSAEGEERRGEGEEGKEREREEEEVDI